MKKKKMFIAVISCAAIAMSGSIAFADETEEITDPRTEIREMRQENTMERKELRKEQRDEMNGVRAENKEDRVQNMQENRIRATERRSERFANQAERMEEKLNNILDRLEEAGADIAYSESMIQALKGKADVVTSAYANYEEKIDAGDKDAIKESLETLKSARDDFRDYYRDTVRPAIWDLVESLQL